MREINVKPKAIILENEGRNTAPAIALGAIKALEEEQEDPLLLILSADHIIRDLNIFSNRGARAVLKNFCMIFFLSY